MAAMMPSGPTNSGNQTANPYDRYDAPTDGDDLIDPDDATLDDLDDPRAAPQSTSSRAPLTGQITPSTSQARSAHNASSNTQSYLNNTIRGEDRRAAQNTIDESVWETLRRDLLAVWEKMRQVLYPKYLLGGVLNNSAEGGMSEGVGGVRGLVGRWPDAEALVQGGMSEGLRDWDLWGPLLFCLLLSFLLSLNAREAQGELVFSGVFATVWIGEALVTVQIKLLGGNV
ncbi:hypothetical protein MBLNU230_g3213t2 [Neophaeotheca triangularis]